MSKRERKPNFIKKSTLPLRKNIKIICYLQREGRAQKKCEINLIEILSFNDLTRLVKSQSKKIKIFVLSFQYLTNRSFLEKPFSFATNNLKSLISK